MTWDGAMTTLAANLTTAGADVTPKVVKIVRGEPDALSTDLIAYWMGPGTRQSSTGANTLTKVNIERGVTITAYLRGATRAETLSATLESRLIALEAAIFNRLWADADLGGNAIGISIDGTEYGWIDIAGQLARVVSLVVWIDLAEVSTISL